MAFNRNAKKDKSKYEFNKLFIKLNEELNNNDDYKYICRLQVDNNVFVACRLNPNKKLLLSLPTSIMKETYIMFFMKQEYVYTFALNNINSKEYKFLEDVKDLLKCYTTNKKYNIDYDKQYSGEFIKSCLKWIMYYNLYTNTELIFDYFIDNNTSLVNNIDFLYLILDYGYDIIVNRLVTHPKFINFKQGFNYMCGNTTWTGYSYNVIKLFLINDEDIISQGIINCIKKTKTPKNNIVVNLFEMMMTSCCDMAKFIPIMIDYGNFSLLELLFNRYDNLELYFVKIFSNRIKENSNSIFDRQLIELFLNVVHNLQYDILDIFENLFLVIKNSYNYYGNGNIYATIINLKFNTISSYNMIFMEVFNNFHCVDRFLEIYHLIPIHYNIFSLETKKMFVKYIEYYFTNTFKHTCLYKINSILDMINKCDDDFCSKTVEAWLRAFENYVISEIKYVSDKSDDDYDTYPDGPDGIKFYGYLLEPLLYMISIYPSAMKIIDEFQKKYFNIVCQNVV